MSSDRRDPAVQRWLRRPLWWLLAAPLLVLPWVGADLFTFTHQLRAAHGDPVEGRVLGSWDGGTDVPVAYVSASGTTVTAIARTDPGTGPEVRIGPVELTVDPANPTTAHLSGYDPWQLLLLPLTLLVPLLGALLVWWWSRHRRMRRSEALAVSDGPAFRMTGVPRPGRISPRRWRMELYPLDAAPGAAPVCSVALIGGDDDVRPRVVEVKGQPRPGGEVAIWEPGSRRVWWPAGRVLLNGSRPLPEAGPAPEAPTHSEWRWIVPAVAAVVMLVAFESGENRDVLLDRSEVVDATVVRGHDEATGPTVVSYRTAEGVEQEATLILAGPQRPGDQHRLRVDPSHPDRAWQPRTSEALPGAEGGLATAIGSLAFLVLIIGLVMVRRPRPAPRPTLGLVAPSGLRPPPPPAPPPLPRPSPPIE